MAKVFDASALLAVVFGEPGAEAAIAHLAEPGGLISAVNWAEVASKMSDQGAPMPQVLSELAHFGVSVVPLDEDMAMAAAALRGVSRKLGLSLGDRCCLALADHLGAEIVTADKAWARLPGRRCHLIR